MNKSWLQKTVGIIFLLAATYRIIFFQSALNESAALRLPIFSAYLIILLELIIGSMLLAGFKTELAAKAGILFLSVAILLAISSNWSTVINDIGELFVFNATPTDILLHCMYILLMLIIINSRKR